MVLLQTWSENVKHYILGLTHSKNQKSWFIKQLIGYNRFLPCVCYWLNYVHAPPPPPSIQYFRLCLCLEIWALKNELNKKEVIRVGRNPIDWCPYRKRRSGPRHNLGGECRVKMERDLYKPRRETSEEVSLGTVTSDS